MRDATSLPDPTLVLSSNASTSTPTRVLSQEDFMKFSIGLRLLGEVKAKRLLSYIQVLQQEQEQEQKENPQ